MSRTHPGRFNIAVQGRTNIPDRIMKRLKSRIKLGRERQTRKMADQPRLQKRAIKQA